MSNECNTAEDFYSIDKDEYADTLDKKVPDANSSLAEDDKDTVAVIEFKDVDIFKDRDIVCCNHT